MFTYSPTIVDRFHDNTRWNHTYRSASELGSMAYAVPYVARITDVRGLSKRPLRHDHRPLVAEGQLTCGGVAVCLHNFTPAVQLLTPGGAQ